MKLNKFSSLQKKKFSRRKNKKKKKIIRLKEFSEKKLSRGMA